MKNAWIVVREERHIDPKFWVCESREDALSIAHDVTDYWIEDYGHTEDDLYRDLYGDQIFHVQGEDAFNIYVVPQEIREPGETTQSESP